MLSAVATAANISAELESAALCRYRQTKRSTNEKPHLTKRNGSITGYVCPARTNTFVSIANTAMVVLWLSSRRTCTNPRQCTGSRHRGVGPVSKLLTTKLKCVAETECSNSADSCKGRTKGNSRQKQQFAFGRSEDTGGKVTPEAVRSAITGNSLICSIRQTKTRPVPGCSVDYSEEAGLAVNSTASKP